MSDNLLVLSLFPGIGLLDRAFQEQGFTVVRGPDVLWGDNIKNFHIKPNWFGGIIGDPPCQQFSRLTYFVKYNNLPIAENLIPEFERLVDEGRPNWFIMENVKQAPTPKIDNYITYSTLLNNRQFGGIQNRERCITFGSNNSKPLWYKRRIFEPVEYAHCVTASGGRRGKKLGYKSYRDLQTSIELQGLPSDFSLPSFTVAGAIKAVGNGVPLPLGRGIALAVWRRIIENRD